MKKLMKKLNYKASLKHSSSVKPAEIAGNVLVSGDKSISHRSIMLGSIASGITEITGFLMGEDCLATRKVFEQMGVVITDVDNKIIIKGVGLHGLMAPKAPLDFGNSGTGMRLMSGLMSGQSFTSKLVGDESLMQRPMRRISEPLSLMGAAVQTLENGCAPIDISPAKQLLAINYQQNVASAQVKSAVLLAGIYANGQTVITEPGISRDHTERMLRSFGYQVDSQTIDDKVITKLVGGGKLIGQQIVIPSDISSAAFFIVAGLIAKTGEVKLQNVGINPTRIGVIEILLQMGADITLENKRFFGAEPVADIVVKPSELTNITVAKSLVPLAIDEFPVIFVAAACAKGEFVLRNAKELRVKESDRLSAMATGLEQLGVSCQLLDDGIAIQGNPESPFTGGTVSSFSDHRIAMSFVMASIRAKDAIVIEDCANINTSFPNFKQLATDIGITLDEC